MQCKCHIVAHKHLKMLKHQQVTLTLHRRAAKYVLAADFATVALFTPQLK